MLNFSTTHLSFFYLYKKSLAIYFFSIIIQPTLSVKWKSHPRLKIMFKFSLHNVPLANREIKTALIEYKASDLMSGAFFQPSITQYKVLPKKKESNRR